MIAIIIGAIFLIMLGMIDLRIPGTYIVTFVLFIGIFGQFSDANVGFFDPQFITAELCGGGLMLGAWFMATDYVTSPITKSGQIVYGICTWTSDWSVPSVRWIIRRCILCDHHQ